ncbi:hypothetical protein LCGC14_2298170 [marine sediment metagenome]|uniref:Uncharacterized protein n=1 Tax=marine sediment metagenome TaxID=412755 RepID=A0A0F9FJA0_9ZZZZ
MIEGLLFVLPIGTQIDRALRNEANKSDGWRSFISTKDAIYSQSDVWNTSGWEKDGGPRFITFSIPDKQWGLVSCNWGSIILCNSNGTSIDSSSEEQFHAFRATIWTSLWNHCRRADHRKNRVHLPHPR